MAQLVKLKRTAVQGKVPSTSNVELGELAINTYDGRIFFEKSSSAESIQEILTTNAGRPITGSLNLTAAITASHFKGDGSALTNVSANISEQATVTSSFDNATTVNVAHNFSSKNVIVSVYDSSDGLIIPQSVTLTSVDNVRVVLSQATSGFVVVAKGGHVLSGSADNANQLNGQTAAYYLNYNNFTNVPGGLVSGSEQITDGSGLVSSSAQLTSTFDTRYLNTNGDSVISSSAQLTSTFDTRYLNTNGDGVISGSVLRPNGDSVISSSAQLTSTFDTRYLNTNGDGVVSGSVLRTLNGTGVVSGSVLRPNGDGVISGSSQVDADTVTNFDSNVLTYINDLGVHSGSFLGTATTTNLTEGTNKYYTDSKVKTKLNAEGVFSSSAQIEGNFLEVNGDSVVSGSSQIDHNLTTNYTASRHIDHSQITVGSGKGLIGGGTIDTNRSITLATGSSHFGEGVINALTGSGIVSSSTQIDSLGFLQVNGDGVLSGSIADQLPSGVISGSAQIDRTWTLGASGTNHYTFTGPGLTGAENDPTIYLTRGETYRFVNNMGAHPFRIQSTPNGSAGTAYNDGVTNNNVSSGTLIIDVQFDAPSKLYYQCTAHSNMGGVIHIIDERPSGVISGSSQVTIGGDATGSANDINVVAINGVTITNAEATQLANINGSTISSTQWEYVGLLNQYLGTTNDVQFNDLVLSGDLTVQGTTTTLNTQELTIEDKLLSVASGSTTTAAADGGGFHISGANASITWDNGNSRLAINKSTHFTGDVQATGDVVAYASSDERLKDNIKPIENPIEKINQISGNSFVWNEEKQTIYKGKDYGVVAQEIEKILPELVNEREDGYKAVKYDKLISLLIEGVKELSKEVNDLKNKIGE